MQVKGIHCPIQDLVIHANLTATKLDEVISAIVTGTRSRIFEVVALQKEIEELSSKYEGLVFDPETRELLIHAEASGRAFVIRVKHGYPTSGWQGLEVVGIEPALQGSSELELWQVYFFDASALSIC